MGSTPALFIMDDIYKPLELPSLAVLRLMHFDVWGTNFLRERLAPFGLKLREVRVASHFTIRNLRTGEELELPTDLKHEEVIVAQMERIRRESMDDPNAGRG
jgi:hypothetical protein